MCHICTLHTVTKVYSLAHFNMHRINIDNCIDIVVYGIRNVAFVR